MRKPFTVALHLIVPLVLVGLVGVSHAQLVLYDDFKHGPIDPAKWFGSENQAGSIVPNPSAPNTEAAREIQGNRLLITLTSWGRTDSSNTNTGNQLNSQSNRLIVTNPVPIKTIQADVTVRHAEVVGCLPDNLTSTRARAQIFGAFFNDGLSPPANRTGDIIARMQSHRDTLTGDQIEASIIRCINANCPPTAFGAVLFSQIFAATWRTGKADTMNIQWDPLSLQFNFTLNPGTKHEEQHSFAISPAPTFPPFTEVKLLSVNNSTPSCPDPALRASAIMEALFDKVMVNNP